MVTQLFARVYLKKRHPKKAVGYCIHLCDYDEELMKKINQLNLILPIMNVSLLNLEKRVSGYGRNHVYNCLWGAGWDCDRQEVKDNLLVYSDVTAGPVSAKAVTYFLDLLALDSEKAIEELIVEPMKEIFAGTEEWVVKTNLPVLKIGVG